MISFRYYQEDALNAAHDAVEGGERRPLVVLPTGAGKSIILGQLAADYAEAGMRVAVLAHVTELIEQNASAVSAVGARAGIYAAKLKRRDLVSPIVCASVQSLGARLRAEGWLPEFDVVLVDEAHRIPRRADTQYRAVLDAMKPKVIVGLTATPYRLDSGRLDRGEDAMFGGIAYEIGMQELVDEGFLCPLRARPTAVEIDTAGLHTRAGDFIQSELEEAALEVIVAMVDDMLAKTHDRVCTIVFAAGVKSAKATHDLLAHAGKRPVLLTGDLSDGARARVVRDVKAGKHDFVVNVGVATTGFDASVIDCVALCRATQSTGLYVQMLGRGTRLHPGKEECIVLDYGANIARLGPPDAPNDIGADYEKEDEPDAPGQAVEKECPACGEMVHASSRTCGSCGFWFPQRAEACAQDGLILRGGRQWLDVTGFMARPGDGGVLLAYEVQTDRGAPVVDELVAFDGKSAPVRWRQLGGIAKTLEAAVQEAQYLQSPHSVLISTRTGGVAVEAASMRPPKRS